MSKKSKLMERGIRAADYKIYQENTIWSRHSNDKVDIGEELAYVIRVLNKAFDIRKPLRALSIGSSAEPQFRILETAFRGGLYLLDVEKKALDIIKERVHRQYTTHVNTILADYTKVFLSRVKTREFLKKSMSAKKAELITLHHSLYYCEESLWEQVFANLYGVILGVSGAIHAVLMSSRSRDKHSTTWLYNHFAGQYFGHRNDQNLYALGDQIKRTPVFNKARIVLKTNRIRFFVDDFEKLMAVVWMILLYPEVHKYSLRQREEITEYVYDSFWRAKRPLVQHQDHLIIFKGIRFGGLRP